MNVKRAIVGAIVMVSLCVVWTYQSFTEQINNSILLQQYAHEVNLVHLQSGSFPQSFLRNDKWGHLIAYFRSDEHFVLASFGLDGKPDVADYAVLLKIQPPGEAKSNCLFPWQDTVFVDGHSWKACFK